MDGASTPGRMEPTFTETEEPENPTRGQGKIESWTWGPARRGRRLHTRASVSDTSGCRRLQFRRAMRNGTPDVGTVACPWTR